MGELINIRGKKLYVEQYGEQNKEVLLYLHGGPGASCLDFSDQAEALSEKLRVIAIDQRGVLRSEPLQPDESFGIMDILEDCEELRNTLGINKWSLLGHSFGGYLALLYANSFPGSIQKILFEAPTFDIGLSMKNLFHYASEKGHSTSIYLNEGSDAKELFAKWGEFCSTIGEYDKDLIYLHNITPDRLNQIYGQVDGQLWKQTQIHGKKLFQEGAIYQSGLQLLNEIPHSALLLSGKYDPVFCSIQSEKYLQNKSNKLVTFEKSGHFPRLEETEKYGREVLQFLGVNTSGSYL
ncbi:alpha/beta fold hydrolase [Sutcliffiella rhizosphaerae]|uniref:2-succinyl-6-hydroxy-2, 4-cyclohexadiene-1-carboxylate synthase n=1 Tax=Sutcliffiella rhizosphaerae TaxID=2880967 RepID=A0ABM8YMP6_9BACI|nr:alpha/beta hydrolase [Sutcliffiella rhizosphaerae]CAG9621120.1 2-succinyl-6-hydroxy-2, 4-cyclohexadiene-1-carboxylate synthase [Sutcliffiella rhizosphaerae]